MPKSTTNIKLFPFTNDYVFNKVLSTYHDLTIELVRVITGNKATIDQINQQEVINPTINSKSCRYDIYLSTKQGDIYDIEMQNKNEHNLAKRTRYYLSSNDINIASHGYEYNQLPMIYIIVICTFDPFNLGKQKYVIKERVFANDNDVMDNTTYDSQYVKIFLNAGVKFKENKSDENLTALINYICSGKPSDDFTNGLQEAVIQVNDKDRNIIMTFEEEMILRSMEDEKKGYNKGLQEGTAQTLKDTVIRMIQQNCSMDLICNVTNLTIDEVNHLIETNNK